MNSVRTISATILLAALTTFPYEKMAPNKVSGIHLPPRDEGTVAGTISYAGRLPIPRPIDMSRDSFCNSCNAGITQPEVVVTGGRLAHAFVYVKGASLEGRTFEPPSSPVVLEYKRCQLVPRVLGIQTGQTLSILNADQTTHNTDVRATGPQGPVEDQSWTIAQSPGSPPVERRIAEPVTSVWVEDTQHLWEKANLFVLPHPFFSVSDLDGSYRITGLPHGRYTVLVWHELFGEKRAEVSIGEGESKSLDFTFAGIERFESDFVGGIPAGRTISGGVLNGRALSLPAPIFPPRVKAAGVAGRVIVEVLIDKDGNVARARAVSGPLKLRPAAINAASQAKFPPTLISGQPVRVKGLITYSYKLR